MNSYLSQTKTAVDALFDLLAREEGLLVRKQESYALMHEAAKTWVKTGQKTGFDSVVIIQLDGFDRAKERIKAEIDEIRAELVSLAPTYKTLAGAILQVAKQGISIRYGGIGSCPDGRLVGQAETLKNVIWQGRNQAMHYEEGRYHSRVQDCFQNLEQSFGGHFTLGSENLALSVLEILGWKDYGSYESDMKLLLP